MNRRAEDDGLTTPGKREAAGPRGIQHESSRASFPALCRGVGREEDEDGEGFCPLASWESSTMSLNLTYRVLLEYLSSSEGRSAFWSSFQLPFLFR